MQTPLYWGYTFSLLMQYTGAPQCGYPETQTPLSVLVKYSWTLTKSRSVGLFSAIRPQFKGECRTIIHIHLPYHRAAGSEMPRVWPLRDCLSPPSWWSALACRSRCPWPPQLHMWITCSMLMYNIWGSDFTTPRTWVYMLRGCMMSQLTLNQHLQELVWLCST